MKKEWNETMREITNKISYLDNKTAVIENVFNTGKTSGDNAPWHTSTESVNRTNHLESVIQTLSTDLNSIKHHAVARTQDLVSLHNYITMLDQRLASTSSLLAEFRNEVSGKGK